MTEGCYPSKEKGRDIHYSFYEPIGPADRVRGVVQIAHGMDEYFGRYHNFCVYLTELGFAVCGNDHLGHGLTAVPEGSGNVPEDNDLGYTAGKLGWQKQVADMHTLTGIAKTKYPGIPYFLFGHSMGSFLSRAYIEKYGCELSGAIISGTGSGLGAEPQLLMILDGLEKIHGDRYRLDLMSKLFFGKKGVYNKKIKDCRTKYDWLSRDPDLVDAYAADPFCTFNFTVNGYRNLVEVMFFVNRDKAFEKYPKDLPTYLISGSADPVGNYGKGVLKVYNKLRLYDCDVEMKIYNGARHELTNEINKGEVYSDVTDFLFSVCRSMEERKDTQERQTENGED
ncbi:MAG: lysophospholipase [Ruminococcus sp.]|nr:lysophospholipase [Ruminococcus sp.]